MNTQITASNVGDRIVTGLSPICLGMAFYLIMLNRSNITCEIKMRIRKFLVGDYAGIIDYFTSTHISLGSQTLTIAKLR